MESFTYTPDRDQKVHEEGAIRLICRAFQSHENGLPEWLKNSADAYAREDAPESRRVILVIFGYGRGVEKPSISCLDFSGMTSKMIEENFRVWADPEAARRGGKAAGVQGGHGNGGKCYMTQMFEDHALAYTVKREKGNRYGVKAGSVRFGYIPDPQRGRDFPVGDMHKELETALKPHGCSSRFLPDAAIKALQQADGFSLVTGVAPKGYGNRIPWRPLVDSLQEHPQMIRTLELCRVFVLVNGEVANEGQPLSLPSIPSMEGADQPRIVPIPMSVQDPSSGKQVSTVDEGSLPPGTLTLRTSNVSMRWSKKGRHYVIYKTKSGYVGYIPVTDLDVQSSYSDRIYGECQLEALDPYKQNERARLATSPLTRAIERFVSEQVQSYAKEFEARDRRRYDQEEKNAISKMNEALDRWKNRFLDKIMRGLWGPGGKGAPPPEPPLPSGKPSRIELALTHQRAGLGVAFRPTLRFYDHEGKRVRPVPFRWMSEDNNVAMVDEDLLVINTFSYGQTNIWAETLDGKIHSNKAPLEVVRILDIRIVPRELEIAVGSRSKLEGVCHLAVGDETSDVCLVWQENNPNVARVSSSGLVFGFSPGETEATAGDDKCSANEPAMIKVVEGHGRGKGGQRGQGFPLICVSNGIDADPETGEEVNFSTEDPPVCQRPKDVDRNIYWINSVSPLSRLYLDRGKGYGHESREWRMYHLERCIDVIVQIALTHGPEGKESVSADEWVMKWGRQAAAIQAAAASDLFQFIASGELPTS